MSDAIRVIGLDVAGRIAVVADALGDLVTDVVFIGGAVAPLLQTHPPFNTARPTEDVDAIAATTNADGIERLYERLRIRGFHQDMSGTAHAHRWIAPDTTPFDLVPAGDHFGATGNRWNVMAVETAEGVRLPSGMLVYHASASGFLGLKWHAFENRGMDDPYGSHDIEDIIAMVASRPNIVQEIANSPPELRRFVSDCTTRFLHLTMADDIVRGALANVFNPRTIPIVRIRLEEVAKLPRTAPPHGR